MSVIKVTAEEIQNLSQSIALGSGNIQDQLSQMQNQIQPLVSGDWVGTASARFSQLWDEWNRSAAGLKDALDGMSQLLQNAGQQYQATEDAIRQSMG